IGGAERPGDGAGLRVEAGRDVYAERGAVRVRRVDAGLEGLQAGRHGDDRRAEADVAELERGPVEVRVEGLGDGHVLGRGGRLIRVVLEVDRVGQRGVGADELLVAGASGANDVVRVNRAGTAGLAAADRRETAVVLRGLRV